ncbi:MAG: hypothetical protein ACLT8Q_03785 [Lachnospiraceae bacterium]
MRKLTKSFQKRQSIASRVLCFLLVLAMVVTMVPALGSGEREESDDPLYDAVKLGLDNAGNTVLGRNSSSDGQYEYGKPGWYRDTGMGRSERLFYDTDR